MMPVYTFSNPVIGQSVPGGAHIVLNYRWIEVTTITSLEFAWVKKMEECVHWTWMPPLKAKVNRHFLRNQGT
jgi:hypothetical protein